MTTQPPAAGGRVEGTATAVRVDAEGGRSVLRFVLRLDDERFVPVEMRGHEVRGVLTEGDRVAVDGYRPGATLRPAVIDNLTTASQVEVWSPSGIGRLLRHGELTTAAVSAVVTSAIGLVVGSLQESGQTPGVDPGPTPPPPEAGDGRLWPYVLGGVVAVVVVGVLVGALLWRRRWHAPGSGPVATLPPAGSAPPPPLPRAAGSPWRRIAAAAAGVGVGLAVVVLLL